MLHGILFDCPFFHEPVEERRDDGAMSPNRAGLEVAQAGKVGSKVFGLDAPDVDSPQESP